MNSRRCIFSPRDSRSGLAKHCTTSYCDPGVMNWVKSPLIGGWRGGVEPKRSAQASGNTRWGFVHAAQNRFDKTRIADLRAYVRFHRLRTCLPHWLGPRRAVTRVPHSDVLSFSTRCTTRGSQEEPLPSGVERGELITLLGGATAAWPLVAAGMTCLWSEVLESFPEGLAPPAGREAAAPAGPGAGERLGCES